MERKSVTMRQILEQQYKEYKIIKNMECAEEAIKLAENLKQNPCLDLDIYTKKLLKKVEQVNQAKEILAPLKEVLETQHALVDPFLYLCEECDNVFKLWEDCTFDEILSELGTIRKFLIHRKSKKSNSGMQQVMFIIDEK